MNQNRNGLEVALDDSDPHPAPAGDLARALAHLAIEQQDILDRLVADLHRTGELGPVLKTPRLRAEIETRRNELARTIAALLAGWHALGGRLRLEAPPLPTEEIPEVRLVLASAALVEPPPEDPGTEAPPPPRVVEAAPPAPAPPPPRREPAAAPPAPAPERPPVDWVVDLGALLGEILVRGDLHEEMETIHRVANTSFIRWAPYPRAVQRALVGNLACRLRHLQDDVGVAGSKLDTAFRSLTRFSKSFQPGWVNGLTRGRGPAAENWMDEARAWWDQLAASVPAPPAAPEDADSGMEERLEDVRRWLGEWRDAPEVAKPMCLEKTLDAIARARDTGLPSSHPDLVRLAGEIYDHLEVPRFRRLRQAIRDSETAEREEREGAEPEAIPSSWAWWSHTVGRRALLVGGRPSEAAAGRIERTLGLASVRWEALGDDEATLHRIRDLVVAGEADLVVVYAAGLPAEPLHVVVRACQEVGVPWARVEPGQSITRTRMALERYLQPDPAPPRG